MLCLQNVSCVLSLCSAIPTARTPMNGQKERKSDPLRIEDNNLAYPDLLGWIQIIAIIKVSMKTTQSNSIRKME